LYVVREAEWQRQVVDLARMYGWLVYHTFDSRRSEPGFPDLTLVNRTFVIAELKTDRGRLSPDQQKWLERLGAAGVEVHVWRPRDLDDVVERLSRR
jgi:hypothetical protein